MHALVTTTWAQGFLMLQRVSIKLFEVVAPQTLFVTTSHFKMLKEVHLNFILMTYLLMYCFDQKAFTKCSNYKCNTSTLSRHENILHIEGTESLQKTPSTPTVESQKYSNFK